MKAGKRLRIGIALGNFIDLPESSSGWRASERESYDAVARAGYGAVQGGSRERCAEAGLRLIGNGVVATASAAMEFARHWKDVGAEAATCIAGFGYESDAEADEIAYAVCEASEQTGLPLYLETHRGSITQDAWRTVQMLGRVPSLLLNGDFSHWFTGQEMAYGDFDRRLAFLAPVFERTCFLHGRIGNRCCLQVPVNDGEDELVRPFEQMWTAVTRAFVDRVDGPSDLWFCPELLGTEYQYARVFAGREETDRWEQAGVLVGVARRCAEAAGLSTE